MNTFELNEPSVITDVIDDETIIMNLKSGDYYSFNASGDQLLRWILAGKSRKELPGVISEVYGLHPSEDEIDAFLDRLLEYQIIVPAKGDGNDLKGGGAISLGRGSWDAPEIKVYSDMKNLLAMDPPLPKFKSGHS